MEKSGLPFLQPAFLAIFHSLPMGTRKNSIPSLESGELWQFIKIMFK
jgi:hypothetical protein